MSDEQLAEAYRRYEMRLNEARFCVDNTYRTWNEAKSALLQLQVNREAIIQATLKGLTYDCLKETQDVIC